MEKIINGKRIRAFRKLKGYTQAEFASKLHISVAKLGAIERGASQASKDFLVTALKELDLSEEDFFLK